MIAVHRCSRKPAAANLGLTLEIEVLIATFIWNKLRAQRKPRDWVVIKISTNVTLVNYYPYILTMTEIK